MHGSVLVALLAPPVMPRYVVPDQRSHVHGSPSEYPSRGATHLSGRRMRCAVVCLPRLSTPPAPGGAVKVHIWI